MKQEKVAWLATNPRYPTRFAFYGGRRCRAATGQAVAREMKLDWHTGKELETPYLGEQVRRGGKPGPRVIGIDESAIKKGHP